MLTRRTMIKRLGLVTAGLMTMESLELLDRLAPRSLFAGGWPSTQKVRLVLDSPYQYGASAMIRDGGYEAVMTTGFPSPIEFRSGDVLAPDANALWNYYGLHPQSPELRGKIKTVGSRIVVI